MTTKLITFLIVGCFALTIASKAQTPSLVWAQSAGSTSSDVGWSIATDATGNIYTAGHFRGTVDFDSGPAIFNLTAFGVFEDIFISKSDANGNFVWAKSFGSTSQDLFDQAHGITYRAGHIYITGLFSGTVDFDPSAGTTNLTSVGGRDVFVLKLDVNGNFVWAKSMGSAQDDIAFSIATDASQSVYTTGDYESLADFDPGAAVFNLPDPGTGSAIFISKLDIDGNFGWAISLGSGTSYNNTGFSVATDLSGDVYTTGKFRSTIDFDPGAGVSNLTSATNSANDIFILKLTSPGSFVWAKSMGSSNEDNGQSIVIDVSGNVVTTGYFDGTVDFDPGTGVSNLTSFGVDDIFISKLDANGNFVWTKQFGGIDEDDGFSVATDAAGNIYMTGFFQDVADFDPGTGIFNLTAVGSTYDIFISKLDQNGDFAWATSIGSAGNDYGRAIATDGSGNVITTGNFKLTADFNPEAATLNFTSAGNDDIFIQKLSNPVVALPTITSFAPTSGPIGTTVTITGANFSTTPSNNEVKFNGTLATVTASTASSITTMVPTGATTGAITVTEAGNTATSASSFTVTSATTIVIATQPSSSTVCSGTTATFTLSASGTTNIAYQWQYSPDGISPFTDLTNTGGYSNVSTATITINSTGNFGAGTYRCKISGDFAATIYSNTAALTVNQIPPIPDVTHVANCGGTAFALTASGATGAQQYVWYDPSSTVISGQTTASYSTPTISSSTIYYVAIIDGTCTSPKAGITITINTIPIAPTASGASICSSGSVTLSASGGTNGQYRWYTVATGGTAITGETNSSYITPPLSVTTHYFVSIMIGTCESTRTQVAATIDGTACNQPPVITSTSLSVAAEGIVTINLLPLISDSDDNLDLNSLKIKVSPLSGSPASINNGVLTINYGGVNFSGEDAITIEVCDLLGSCTEQQLTVEVTEAEDVDIVIYNGISPNGDTFNATWQIQNIEILPETRNNKVTLYNRWGDEVFSTANYDNKVNVFKGLTNGGSELPSGTYFYKIEFESGRNSKTGYLTLKK